MKRSRCGIDPRGAEMITTPKPLLMAAVAAAEADLRALTREGADRSPDQIRAARHRAGLSQSAAGRLIGRSLRVWQAYEAGERGIDPVLWQVWLIRAGLAPVASILVGANDSGIGDALTAGVQPPGAAIDQQ
jgi:hypothetical protein